jgi:hypothetical protein
MLSTSFRKGLIGLPLLAMSFVTVAPAALSTKSAPVASHQDANMEVEASKLLRQVKSLSAELRRDAGILESYKLQPTMSWQSHAAQLNKIRHHINQIGDRLARLQAIQPGVAPWQQTAIDHVVPVGAALATHTQSAIEHLNDNRSILYAGVYADHLTSMSERSGELKASIDTFVDYGNTSDKLERLQEKVDGLQERTALFES